MNTTFRCAEASFKKTSRSMYLQMQKDELFPRVNPRGLSFEPGIVWRVRKQQFI